MTNPTNMKALEERVSQIIDEHQEGNAGPASAEMYLLNRYIFAHALPSRPDPYGRNEEDEKAFVCAYRGAHLSPLDDFESMSLFGFEQNTYGIFWLTMPGSEEPIDLLDREQEMTLYRGLMYPGDTIDSAHIEYKIQLCKSLIYLKTLPNGKGEDESYKPV